MKVRIILLYLFLTVLSIKVFGQTADVKEGCAPLQVKFQAPGGSTTWFWDFKDGVTSNKQNPTNIFNKAGTYNVVYKESPAGPIIGTIQIKVYDEPSLNIKTVSGCAPVNILLTNLSQMNSAITATNYTWVFGDGSNAKGLGNATHMYNAVGTYDVSLSIETNFPSCNKTVIFNKIVTIVQKPFASFIMNPPSGVSCKDTLDVSFTNVSTGTKPMTYAWDFNNGKTSTAQNPPSQRYFKGTYSPQLTVKYTDATLTGCSSTATASVSVGKPNPNIKGKDTVCINTPTTYKTTTPGIYNWSPGPDATVLAPLDNSGIPLLTKDSLVVSFNKSGNHQVGITVTSSNGQCSGSKTFNTYVDQVTASIDHTPSFSCSEPLKVQFKANSNQTKVNYFWQFEDFSTSNSQSLTKTYYSTQDTDYYSVNGMETYISQLTVISKTTGCRAFATASDTLWIPNARLMPDKSKGCVPLDVIFTDLSSSSPTDPIVGWKWMFGDGNSQVKTDGNPVTYKYNTPGEYLARIRVTTKHGCIDTSYAVLIEVGDDLKSKLDFTVDKTEVCPGETVTFTANPDPSIVNLIDGYHFTTEGNRSFHCDDEKNLTWTYDDEAGPKDVSLTVDYNGCFSTITKPGLVNAKGAIAKIDYYALCSDPLNYNFKSKSQNATTLAWTFGDSQTSTLTDVTHHYGVTGDYNVTLTASNGNGCAPNTANATIHVRQLQAKIKADTVMCINVPYAMKANTSVDVDARCYTGYTWQFPTMDKRPYTSASSTSTFTFDTPGVHTLRLITKDINGCKDTVEQKFKIYDIKINTTMDKSALCIPNQVQYKDFSTGDTTLVKWDWYFGDGLTQTTTNGNPITHNFTTVPVGGAYYYGYVTITDKLGCSELFGLNLTYYKPKSIVSISDQTLCVRDKVTITASDYTAQGSHLSYDWDFGNGVTSTNVTNLVQYSAATDFNVKLKYTEVSSGCKGDTTVLVQVQDYPKAYTYSDKDTLDVICAPVQIHFADSSKSNSPYLTHSWDFGNGQTAYNVASYNTFYDRGTYLVKHIVYTSFGCPDTTRRTYKVFKPLGNFDIDKNLICKGESIKFTLKDTMDVGSYKWFFGDGNAIENQAPISHAYNFHPPSGQTLAKLVLRGPGDICPITSQKEVNIREVIADFDRLDGQDSSICFSEGAYNLTNKSVSYDSYSWNFGDGTGTTTTLNPSHTFPAPGTYNVTLAVLNNTAGCKDTIIKQAVVFPNPKVVGVGDTVCLGDSLLIYVKNPVATSKYKWTPSAGLKNDTIVNPKVGLQHSVTYTIIETDTNGCTGNDLVDANVIEPIGFQDWDTTIIIGDEIHLPVFRPNLYHFAWSPSTGLSCQDCSYPKTRPLSDILYKLTVTDVLGCYVSPSNYNIIVKPNTFIKLPTAFTPNGDGSNDVVYVKGWGIKELIEFQIFNRWGQLLYEGKDINEGWDGKFNGEVQNSDAYAYKVKVLTWKDEILYTEGYVNLLH